MPYSGETIDPAGFALFILDMDGTLIDTEKYHCRSFASAVQALGGYRLEPHEHREFFAGHSIPYTRVLNERYGLSLDPERVLLEKRRRMREIFKAELFDGAGDFLEQWHGIKPMALATNSPRFFALEALEEAGILHYFDCIMTADEVDNRKPHPEIFSRILKQMSVQPADALSFEDQLAGIRAAQAADLTVVAVDNGQSVEFPEGVPVATWRELLSA